MAIFAIADLHLSLGGAKPMDIFSGWDGYVEKLERNWRESVGQGDTVVLPGDISWAMTLGEAAADFAFINRLPGQKIILKGNHDYWWSTRRKMDDWLLENGFDTLHILHNNSYCAEGLAICGTRGWMLEEGEAFDQKVYNREFGRLVASLKAAEALPQPVAERVVFLHYPPIFINYRAAEFIDAMRDFGVKRCYYGHIHGKGIRAAFSGEYRGIEFRLVSADALGFCPLLIH